MHDEQNEYYRCKGEGCSFVFVKRDNLVCPKCGLDVPINEDLDTEDTVVFNIVD